MTITERDAHPLGEDLSRPRGTEGSWWASLRPLLLRLHFYAGVFVGPFLLVAALTGILYVYTPQLERALYQHELRVPPGAGSVSLRQQVEIAQAEVPDGVLKAVRPAPSPTETTQVIFDRPGLAEHFSHTVFIDPHTGQVRGTLETYGSGQALPVRAWIDQLHQNLHLGEAGRLYSELAASWLWVIVLGGLGLWIGHRRRKRTAPPPAGGPTRRGRLRSWHGSVGLWAAVGLLFLSASGLSWSLLAGANIAELRSALDWTTPSVSTEVPSGGSPAGADVGLDAVRAVTRRAGLSDPVEIRPPTEPGKAYVVAQVQRHWPEKQDSMAVDPATGEITDTLRFADYPLMAKLTRWGIDAHMGILFGLPNQLALTALGLGLIFLIGWGYRMWWLRRPTWRAAWAGRPPARGAWRRVPGKVLAPLLVATAVIGYFFPLFGISLVGFLVVDALLGSRAARQRRSVAK